MLVFLVKRNRGTTALCCLGALIVRRCPALSGKLTAVQAPVAPSFGTIVLFGKLGVKPKGQGNYTTWVC